MYSRTLGNYQVEQRFVLSCSLRPRDYLKKVASRSRLTFHSGFTAFRAQSININIMGLFARNNVVQVTIVNDYLMLRTLTW